MQKLRKHYLDAIVYFVTIIIQKSVAESMKIYKSHKYFREAKSLDRKTLDFFPHFNSGTEKDGKQLSKYA